MTHLKVVYNEMHLFNTHFLYTQHGVKTAVASVAGRPGHNVNYSYATFPLLVWSTPWLSAWLFIRCRTPIET